MFQHELRVWREWQCSQCSRTVRTRGNVSARQCPCVDPPAFMTLVDPPRKTDWDVSPFVTYQTEELTTPTEKELNEELPEWEGRAEMEKKIEEKESRPRRGVGFLRAESADIPDPPATEGGTETDDPSADFGEGLLEEGPASEDRPAGKRSRRRRGRQGAETDASSRSEVTDAGEATSSAADSPAGEGGAASAKTGRKRRRRRNRRSRRNSDKPDATSSVPAADSHDGADAALPPGRQTGAADAAAPFDGTAVQANGGTSAGGESSSGESEGAPKKKRRRRRRRNKKKGTPDGSAGADTPNDANDSGGPDD